MKVKYTNNRAEVEAKLLMMKELSAEGIGKQLVSDIKKVTPVDTGKLRDSIDYQVDQGLLIIGSTSKYAAAVELGTSKMIPNSFLKSTVDSSFPAIELIVRENMSKL